MSKETLQVFATGPDAANSKPRWSSALRGGASSAGVIFLAVVLLLSSALDTQAHGELQLQIDEASRLIRVSPTNAARYFKRGELLRAHGELEFALADLATARRLDATLPELDFTTGRTLFEAERFAEARGEFDRALAQDSAPANVLWFRAQTLVKLERHTLAEADFKQLCQLLEQPSPELILARVANLEAAGKPKEALDAIKEGINSAGGIRTLELRTVDLELKTGDADAAVARLDRLIAGTRRKESLFVRKADVLESLGRSEAARANYQLAHDAVLALPDGWRNTRLTQELLTRIDQKLAELSADKDGARPPERASE